MGDSALDVVAREHEEVQVLLARTRDPGADRIAAWHEAVARLATHVAVERTFLYPLVKRHDVGPAGLAEQLRSDYKRMEHLLVLTERRKLNSPDVPGLVTQVADAFEAHQERCARLLLPEMRARLGKDGLEELGARMRSAENVILSHPHPHLLALGPVYQWTTRLASAWDGLRDRSVSNR